MAARRSRVRGARTALCAGLALLLGGCVAGTQVVPVLAVDGQRLGAPAPTDPYERGKVHLRDGQFGLALQAFRAVLARDPDAVMALNGIAIVYDQLGRFELARRYYERAVALQPAAIETLNNAGYSALRRGELAQAQAYFERARRLGPDNAVVLANLTLAAGAEIDVARIDPTDAAGAAPTRLAAPPTAWVERTSASTQTVVTRPDPDLAAAAWALGVPPALVSFVPPALEPAATAVPIRRLRPAAATADDATARPLRLFDALAAPYTAPADDAAAGPLRLFDALAATDAAVDDAAAGPLHLFDALAARTRPTMTGRRPTRGGVADHRRANEAFTIVR